MDTLLNIVKRLAQADVVATAQGDSYNFVLNEGSDQLGGIESRELESVLKKWPVHQSVVDVLRAKQLTSVNRVVASAEIECEYNEDIFSEVWSYLNRSFPFLNAKIEQSDSEYFYVAQTKEHGVEVFNGEKDYLDRLEALYEEKLHVCTDVSPIVCIYQKAAAFDLSIAANPIVIDSNSLDVLISLVHKIYRQKLAGEDFIAIDVLKHQKWVGKNEIERADVRGSTDVVDQGISKIELAPVRNANNTNDSDDYAGVYSQKLDSSQNKAISRLATRLNVSESVLLLGVFRMLLRRLVRHDDGQVGLVEFNAGSCLEQGELGQKSSISLIDDAVSLDVSFDKFVSGISERKESDQYIQSDDFAKENQLNLIFKYTDGTGLDLSLSDESIQRRDTSDLVKPDISFEFLRYDDTSHIIINYSTRLYSNSYIEALASRYIRLLGQIAKNSRKPISDYKTVDKSEEKKLVDELNGPEREFANGICLHHLFEEKARLCPDEIAVKSYGELMTYSELEVRTRKLALHLQAVGIKAESLVSVCLDRRSELIISLMAVLRAGGAYVPIDPDYPAERIAYILKDSGSKVVITQRKYVENIAKNCAEDTVYVIVDEDSKENTTEEHSRELLSSTTEDNLAYVIYTSGSTGNPKGVAIEHKSPVKLIQWASEVFSEEETKGVLASTSICFDLSVYEIFFTLSRGGTIVLAKNALELSSIEERTSVSLINTVPSAMEELIRSNAVPQQVKTINLAGEPLAQSLVDRIYENTSVEHVYDLYGPSEDTTYSTYVRREKNGTASIGKPIANTKAYVLDENLQLVPEGVPGELYLSGAGLARGYLGRDDLTKERFLDHPYENNQRIYQTGDLVRWSENGLLEYMGRLDNQVKVRGYRIEIGEIETRLNSYDGLKEGVVIAYDTPSGKQLVAFYVQEEGKESVNIQKVKEHILTTLPAYMVPSIFEKINAIPLTPNGKIDRKTLAKHTVEVKGNTNYQPPRNETERKLVSIWQQALSVSEGNVSVLDGFYDLGGHSLLAIKLVTLIRSEFGVEIPSGLLLDNASVENIASVIDQSSEVQSVSIPRYDWTDYPCEEWASPAQERLWFINKLESQAGYNVPKVLQLTDEVDPKVLENAFNSVIERHASLRTVFKERDGNICCHVAEKVRFKIEEIDCRNATNKDKNSSRESAIKICQTEAFSSFDLSNEVLLRVKLIELADNERWLLVNMHHIISDDWSLSILLDEVFEYHDAVLEGRSPSVTETPLQYINYALWEKHEYIKSDDFDSALSYWQSKLKGVPEGINFPTDYIRPTVQSYDGSSVSFELDKQTYNQMKALANNERATLYMVLLSAIKILMYRYSGETDICLGGAVANRQLADTESAIGMFANTLPLRDHVDPSDTFSDVLKKVKTTLLEAFEHPNTPFEKIVEAVLPERHPSLHPLFQVMVILQNVEIEVLKRFPEPFLLEREKSKFDMTIEFFPAGEKMQCVIEYGTHLFTSQTIERFSKNIVQILQSIARDPNMQVSKLDIVSDDEKNTLEQVFNHQSLDLPESNVADLLSTSLSKFSDKTAVSYSGKQLSYSQLALRTEKLADVLISKGVLPNTRVCIFTGRAIELVVGTIGVLRSGAAYIPVDPEYPVDRIKYMLADSNIETVVATPKTHGVLIACGLEEDQIVIIDVNEDIGESSLDNASSLKTVSPGPDDLAYVIYTSGSTGSPKGAQNTQKGFANLLSWYVQDLGISENDRVLILSNPSFDLTQKNIVAPVLAGATIHLCRDYDTAKIKSQIHREQITWINCAPSGFYGLVDKDNQAISSLKTVVLGGEPIHENKVSDWFNNAKNDVRLINSYGPSEASDVVCIHEVKELANTMPIGKPVRNVELLVLDVSGNIVPIGVPGEICISGVCVGLGYLNMPEKTNEVFVPHPTLEGKVIYRSGDLGKWNVDGELEYLGRIDTQVKIRGFRVELEEIESVISDCNGIDDSVVITKGEGANAKLVAFYVSDRKDSEEKILHELRVSLVEALPDYMVPSSYKRLDEIPLTPNGKIDRKLLEALEVNVFSLEEYEAASSDIEADLVSIWADELNLKISDIGINDSYFSIGGNSLNVISLCTKISNELNVKLSPVVLFKYPSIKHLAEYIVESIPARKDSSVSANITSINAASIEDVKSTDVDAFESPLDIRTEEDYEDAIAIIGISCQLPDASDHWEFWNNIVDGLDSTRGISLEDAAALGVPQEYLEKTNYVPMRSAMEGKDCFDPEFFKLSSGNAELMDPQLRQLLMHSWKSIEDAGYRCSDIPKSSVFVSAGNNFYQSALYPPENNYHITQSSEEFVSWTLGQGGTIPTMISYHLGLVGPSAFVHTNCSSSLTALYYGVQSLRAGDADYSLVGAASLAASNSYGYLHESGLNLSSSGKLKAFDASADGMVEGEGVAVVVLKRAVDAIRDKDNIYCVIRGVGINNDGNDKAGYYAPSVSGQAKLIRQVIERHDIDPQSIEYIEAHGTGTSLGDPIEISALTEAFSEFSTEKAYCGIGSVKPNVGHLDAAAGLVGTIKVALSLYNKAFVGNIHFSKPNPLLELDDSPFFIQEKTSAWTEKDNIKRAALSSFGIGGSNAHAIFEEYRKRDLSLENKDFPCIIPISAKKPDLLKKYVEAIQSHIVGNEARLQLPEVAYTLQHGREEMEARVAFVVKSLQELVDQMALFIEGKDSTRYFSSINKSALPLNTEFGDDEDFQEMVKLWVSKKKLTKLATLWVSGSNIEWARLSDSKQRRESLPTYPFNKKPYWIKNNANHHANQNIVSSASELHPFLHTNTSDFSCQKYITRIAGTEQYLKDHIIRGEKVFPAVVYLEVARAAIQDSLPTELQDYRVGLSNVVWTSPFILKTAAEMITEVEYDGEEGFKFTISSSVDGEIVEHCQGQAQVISDDRIPEVDLVKERSLSDIDSVDGESLYEAFVQMGTGYGLSFQTIKSVRIGDKQVLAEFTNNGTAQQEGVFLLPGIIDGALQAGLVLIAGEERYPRSTTLPFSLNSLDVWRSTDNAKYARVCYSANQNIEDILEGRAKLIKIDIELIDDQGRVCAGLYGFASRPLKEFKSSIEPENSYFASRWNTLPAELDLNISTPDNALQHLIVLGQESRGAIEHALSGVDKSNYVLDVLDAFGLDNFNTLSKKVYGIVKSYIENKSSTQVMIRVISCGPLSNLGIALHGLLSTANLENPKVSGQVVILDDVKSLDFSKSISGKPPILNIQENEYNYRDWNPLSIQNEQLNTPYKEGGVYLITGGLGGIASHFCRDILDTTKASTVVLVGRSALEKSTALKNKFNAIKNDYPQHKLQYVAVDITDSAEVKNLIEKLLADNGTIDGVLHTAGIVNDSFILNKTESDYEKVLNPKTIGTLNIDAETSNLDLDFLVLFSSESSFGSLGQADYASANGFLNEFSSIRNQLVREGKRGGKTVAINWPYWLDGGMELDASQQEKIQHETGMQAMPSENGLEALRVALTADVDNILVLYGLSDRISKHVENLIGLEKQANENAGNTLADEGERFSKALPSSVSLSEGNPHESLISLLKHEFSLVFKLDVQEINESSPLEDYGIDSILAVSVTNSLEKIFGNLPKTLLFEYHSISELAEYFSENHGETLSKQKQSATRNADVAGSSKEASPESKNVPLVANAADLRELTRGYLVKEFSNIFKKAEHELDENAQLEDYGIDSILSVSLINKLEESFGALPKTLLFEYRTISEVLDYFLQEHEQTLKGLLLTNKNDVSQKVEYSQSTNSQPIGTNTKQAFNSFTSKVKNKIVVRAKEEVSDAIAIVGLSGRYPRANNVEEYWENISQGKDCITEVPASRWDWEDYYTDDRSKDGHHYSNLGGFIEGHDEFDAKFFNITPREATILDPQERIFLQTAWHAVEDAGYSKQMLQIPRDDSLSGMVGVYVGVMYSEYQLYGAESSLAGKRTGFAGSLADIANRVSYVFNIHGPSYTLDTMCSSSLTALHLACQDLKNHTTDMAISGGVNLNIHPNKYFIISSGQYVSTSGRCLSFGEGGDGYIPGEGVGAVVLKRLSDAERDNDNIYGVIRGSALNHGGKTNGYTVPNPQAQADVIGRAIKQSGVDPRAISYIEAHGTGTKLGDPIEISALNKALKKSGRTEVNRSQPEDICYVGSVKSNIGHCEPAAGIAGLTKVLLQFKHQKIAPSLHSQKLNPNIQFESTPFKIIQDLTPWETKKIDGVSAPRIAGLSSFGAGGSNAHLILEEYRGKALSVEASNDEHIILLSAKKKDQLQQKVQELSAYLAGSDNLKPLASIAYTLNVGREHMKFRVAFCVKTLDELVKYLGEFDLATNRDDKIIYLADQKASAKTKGESLAPQDIKELIEQNKLTDLARYWLSGKDLDWSQLYSSQTPKLSLPGYPFAKDKYWVEKVDASKGLMSATQVDQIHPLLHRNVSTLHSQVFTSTFSAKDSLLYKKAGSQYLSQLSMLEMARVGAEKTLGKQLDEIEIRDVVWSTQLEVEDQVDVSIAYLSNENTSRNSAAVGFEVFVEREDSEDLILSQGYIFLRDKQHSRDKQNEPHNTQLLNDAVINSERENSPYSFIKEIAHTDQGMMMWLDTTMADGSSLNDFVIYPLIVDNVIDQLCDKVYGLSGSQRGIEKLGQFNIDTTLENIECIHVVKNTDVFDIDFINSDGKICARLRSLHLYNEVFNTAVPQIESQPKLAVVSDVNVQPQEKVLDTKVATVTNISATNINVTDIKVLDSIRVLEKPSGLLLEEPKADAPQYPRTILSKPRVTLGSSEATEGLPESSASDFFEATLDNQQILSVRFKDDRGSKDLTILFSELISLLNKMKTAGTIKAVCFSGDGNWSAEQHKACIESGFLKYLISFDLPTVAAFQQGAMGGAFIFSSLCDLWVVNEGGQYAYCLADIGLYPDAKIEQLFDIRFGSALTNMLLFTRSVAFSGAELKAYGWKSPVISEDEFSPWVEKLNKSLADKPVKSLQLLKKHMAKNMQEAVELLAGDESIDSGRADQQAFTSETIETTKFISVHADSDSVLKVGVEKKGLDANTILEEFNALVRSVNNVSCTIQVEPTLLNSIDNQVSSDNFAETISAITQSTNPLVAIVSGTLNKRAALLALLSDSRIFVDDAKLNFDLFDTVDNVSSLLANRFGFLKAKEILLCKEPLTGEGLKALVPSSEICNAETLTSVTNRLLNLWNSMPAGLKKSYKSNVAAKLSDFELEVLDDASEDGNEIEGEPTSEAALVTRNSDRQKVELESNVISAFSYDNGVLLIEMHDREARNMHSVATLEGMLEVFAHIAQSNTYKVVILTGYDSYFSSGGTKEDLVAIQEGKAKFTDTKIYHLAMECQIPVIGAMQGHGLGAGWVLGMFSDVHVFASESKYLSPYMEFGFTPGAGATLVYPLMLGNDLAKESLFTAREMSGKQLGLRDRSLLIKNRNGVVDHAFEIANRLAIRNREYLIAVKEAFVAEILDSLEETYESELSMHEATFVGQDSALERIENRFNAGNAQKAENTEKADIVAPVKSNEVAQIPTISNTAENSADSVLSRLRDMLAEELLMEPSDIDEDESFVDMGLDSIYGVTWVRKINEAYSIDVDAISIYSYPNLTEFSAYIQSLLPSNSSAGSLEPISANSALKTEVKVEAKPAAISEASVTLAQEPKQNVESQQKSKNYDVAAVLQALKAMLAEELSMEESEIDEDDQFIDLGLDSIYGVTWVRKINETYALDLDATTVYSYPNLNEYASFVASQLTDSGQQAGVMTAVETEQPAVTQEEKVLVKESQAQAENADASVLNNLREMLASELQMEVEEVEDDATFIDLGLDSIYGVTWIRKINEKYSIDIDAVSVYSYPNLAEFSAFVSSQLAPSQLPSATIEPKPVAKIETQESSENASSVKALSVQEQDVRDAKLKSWRIKGDKLGKGNAPTDLTKPIAIVGMAGQFAASNSIDEFWQNISEGKNCISEVSADRWDINEYFQEGEPTIGKSNSKWMGCIEHYDKFDPLFFNISPIEAEAIDPQQRVFLESCWNAIEDSGYSATDLSGENCGVFVGSGHSDYIQLNPQQQFSAQGFTGNAISILAARISYYLNLRGPCITLDTACSSSLVAIANACDALNARNADVVLAGGVYVMAGPFMHIKTAQSGMLSKDGACFTFDQRANGFVPGEGVGVVMLKRMDDAIRDGDNIRAVIEGWGVNQDGKTNGITAPNVESQTRLQTSVYNKFNINPRDIQLVEAHGTGTKLGDPIEVQGLKSSFQTYTDDSYFCALGSVKSNIGHCMAAAGVASVIKTALALENELIPPTINYEKTNEHIKLNDSPFYVADSAKAWTVESGKQRRAVISSYGFSGTNAHMVLREAPEIISQTQQENKAPGEQEYVALFSAKTPEQLNERLSTFTDYLKENRENISLKNISYTLAVGRVHMEERLGFKYSGYQDLLSTLEKLVEDSGNSSRLPSGVYRSSISKNKDVMRMFDNEEDFGEVIQKWIDSGRYGKLVELWSKGVSVDWKYLFAKDSPRPQRESLPTYPFSRERYWLTEEIELFATKENTLAEVIHPLLHKNTSTVDKLGFTSSFSTSDSFLVDHKVEINGVLTSVLPGAAYLEMAKASVQMILDDDEILEVSNGVWIQPLVVTDTTEVFTNIYPVYESEELVSHFDVEISTYVGNSEVVHFQCIVGTTALLEQKVLGELKLPVKNVTETLAKLVNDKSDLYRQFKEGGIDYGATHQGLSNVSTSNNEVFALIEFDKNALKAFDSYSLHPSIVDCAFQSTIGLADGSKTPFLPFSIENVVAVQNTTAKSIVRLKRNEENRYGSESQRLVKYDIDIANEFGDVCVSIQGFCMRKLGGEGGLQSSGASADFDVSKYEEIFEKVINQEISIEDAVELG